MRAAVIGAWLCAIGCGASVDGPAGADGRPRDATPGGDAGRDASAVDAAPCTGGNAQAVDGPTCYEAFLALPLAWTAAEDVCAARGGALVRVDDAVENALVAALVGANRAWIGATDAAAEGAFAWSDGAPLAFSNWRAGEPNNGNGAFEEDCALVEGQNGGTWDDRPCDTDPAAGVPGQYYYVCER